MKSILPELYTRTCMRLNTQRVFTVHRQIYALWSDATQKDYNYNCNWAKAFRHLLPLDWL